MHYISRRLTRATLNLRSSRMNLESLKIKALEALKVKVVYEIDYNDLDEIINEYFIDLTIPWKKGDSERAYEIVAYEYWGNGESHSETLEKKPLTPYEQGFVDDAKLGKWRHYSTGTYLQELVNADILPEGELIINIFW